MAADTFASLFHQKQIKMKRLKTFFLGLGVFAIYSLQADPSCPTGSQLAKYRMDGNGFSSVIGLNEHD
jgi:hypothetical protein